MRSLALVSCLAIVSVAGIVGMLPFEGTWDAAFFVLASLPLAVGGWRLLVTRRLRARL